MLNRRQARRLTPDAFPPEMRDALGTVHELSYPRQGYTSAVAIVSCERGSYVIKHSRGKQYTPWLVQEFEVLRTLQDVSLRIPRPISMIKRYVAGTPEAWLLMTRLPGAPLRAVAAAEQDAQAKRRMLYKVGQLLATMHRQPVPPILRKENWLDEMLGQARYNLRHHSVDGDATQLQYLETQCPSPTAPTLIHGDFTIDNVLIEDGEVSGLIDWAGGAYGDPRYDLALMLRPKPDIFQRPAEVQAFLDGYGISTFDKDIYEYFVTLYEFF